MITGSNWEFLPILYLDVLRLIWTVDFFLKIWYIIITKGEIKRLLQSERPTRKSRLELTLFLPKLDTSGRGRYLLNGPVIFRKSF